MILLFEPRKMICPYGDCQDEVQPVSQAEPMPRQKARCQAGQQNHPPMQPGRCQEEGSGKVSRADHLHGLDEQCQAEQQNQPVAENDWDGSASQADTGPDRMNGAKLTGMDQ